MVYFITLLEVKNYMATHNYGVLEIEEARYLANLIGIERDLKTTIDWCNKYKELFSSNELMQYIEPMTNAILVNFMRAFGGGIRNTKARHLLGTLTNEQNSQYEQYRKHRDNHIAHSINEFEENYVKAYYIEEDIEEGITSIQTGCSKVIGLSFDDADNIINICNVLMSALKQEMKIEKDKILVIAIKYTKDEILQLSKESQKSPAKIDVSKRRK